MSSALPVVILKFGGTSVSTRERWETLQHIASERIKEGLFPVVVCSAVTKMTDALAELAGVATTGKFDSELSVIVERHRELATSLDVDLEEAVGAELLELERLALGASLLREDSPRLSARIMAFGELLSTRIGAAFLNRQLRTSWVDARTCLQALEVRSAPEAQRYLSATVSDDASPALRSDFEALAKGGAELIVTQGFIASDGEGRTVLLGRGGSDTSASLFAAKLEAVGCEIWTDVPGVFSADPRVIPGAQLVKRASYAEAQEIASMGAKVLHPRSIPPCRRHRIPMEIRWTERPSMEGTQIVADSGAGDGQVKAVCHKRGVVLVSMETQGMWQEVGFLADVFQVFKSHGLSIDLVSTSEMNVTATLDQSANTIDDGVLERLCKDLQQFCRVTMIRGAAAVSLVGRRIRAILHELAPVLRVFEEQKIHLVSQASSDLNLTFVVDGDQAERLVRELHALLFHGDLARPEFGPSWRQLHESPVAGTGETKGARWWRAARRELIDAASEGPAYVYSREQITRACRSVQGLSAVSRVFYAMKANGNAEVLGHMGSLGVHFECVSLGEIARARECAASPKDVLYTPNFASKEEVRAALALGVQVTLDNAEVLRDWGDILRGKKVFLRVDPGTGRGHHAHVRTGGSTSKFGIPLSELDIVRARAAELDLRIVGLHAHAGSGIFDGHHWAEMGMLLAREAERFPEVAVLDLGGGLGVVEKPGQAPLDLEALGESLMKVKKAHPNYELWMEPGRFLIASAGVLVARVTQTKTKGEVHYVGLEAGMNALIRPALYGAHHEIVNLSRIDTAPSQIATVVGPICESGDVLGHARPLPPTEPGDVFLIATAGAYGSAMSSDYNLRARPRELLLG